MTDGQTDGQTDGIAIAYARLAYMLSRAKMNKKQHSISVQCNLNMNGESVLIIILNLQLTVG